MMLKIAIILLGLAIAAGAKPDLLPVYHFTRAKNEMNDPVGGLRANTDRYDSSCIDSLCAGNPTTRTASWRYPIKAAAIGLRLLTICSSNQTIQDKDKDRSGGTRRRLTWCTGRE